MRQSRGVREIGLRPRPMKKLHYPVVLGFPARPRRQRIRQESAASLDHGGPGRLADSFFICSGLGNLPCAFVLVAEGYYPPVSRPYYAPPGRAPRGWIAGLPPEDQPEANQTAEPPPQVRRQDCVTTERAGTIIIRTCFSIWCSAAVKRCATASASAGKASLGWALSASAE